MRQEDSRGPFIPNAFTEGAPCCSKIIARFLLKPLGNLLQISCYLQRLNTFQFHIIKFRFHFHAIRIDHNNRNIP